MKNNFLIAAAMLVLCAANIFGQTGGTFAITGSVIASGGGQQAAGGAFSLIGTTGQSVAGNAVSGSPFAVTSGFWNFTPLAPSAANVFLGGRILTPAGAGIRNVSISLTNASGGGFGRRNPFRAIEQLRLLPF
jgi:hypothetical protein